MGELCGRNISFLVDSGSNSTLISMATYQNIDEALRPALQTTDIVLMGVNRNELKIHGVADFQVKFEDQSYLLFGIVCDIAPPAILGQDFLIKHSCKLDYKHQKVTIGNSPLSCWIGGEAEMICIVRVKETTTIPPLSSVYLPVDIPHKDQLSRIALIEPASSNDKVHLLSGIIDTTEGETKIQIQNHDSEEATLFKNTKIGECQSIYLISTLVLSSIAL